MRLILSDVPEWAALFTHVQLLIQRLEDREIGDKPDAAPLPRGVITCGEAYQFFPLLLVLIAEKFPEFGDPDQLTELLAVARMMDAGGKPN